MEIQPIADDSLDQITVGLGWRSSEESNADHDLDVVAIMLGAGDALPDNRFFVYYNNPKSPDGAVSVGGDDRAGGGSGDNETLTIDFQVVDARVEEIVVAASIHDAAGRDQNFYRAQDALARVIDDRNGSEIARFDLEGDFGLDAAVELARFHRRNGTWQIEIVGSGSRTGLQSLLSGYRIQVPLGKPSAATIKPTRTTSPVQGGSAATGSTAKQKAGAPVPGSQMPSPSRAKSIAAPASSKPAGTDKRKSSAVRKILWALGVLLSVLWAIGYLTNTSSPNKASSSSSFLDISSTNTDSQPSPTAQGDAATSSSLDATPAASGVVAAASSASDAKFAPIGQVPVKDVAFDQYKTDVYSGPSVFPDFSGAQIQYRQYRTRIAEGAKSGVNFAGQYSIVTFGCGAGCSMGFLVDLKSGDVHDLGYGGEEQLYLNLDSKPDSRLLKASYSDEKTCYREAASWDGSHFQVIARETSPVPAGEMGMDCPPIADAPAAAATAETTTPAAQPSAVAAGAAPTPQTAGGPSSTVQALMAKDHGPSFDCSKVTNPTAVAICGDTELSRLDLQMAILYFSQTHDGTDPDARAQQRAWIQNRNSKCGIDVACLRAEFKSRVELLQNPQQSQQPQSLRPAPLVAPAPSPDEEYNRRANSECSRGFFGKSCRHNIRDQVCVGKTGAEPGASVCVH